MSLLVALVGFVVGAVVWSFLEYVLHRFAFHERRGASYASRVHLRHHARRDYLFGVQWPSWVAVLTVGALVGIAGVLLGAAVLGWALGIGFVVAYFAYEGTHAVAHVRAPRSAYGRWVRRHHFHHHFTQPLRNHGVTTPFWDHVFGTYDAVSVVTVPRRMAMVWLLDDDGEVDARHRDTYRVRGSAQLDEVHERERAFENLAPLL